MTILMRSGQLDINNSSACLVPQNLHTLYYSDSKSRKERWRAQMSHLIVSTVSMCCCICFVSKRQYYMKLDMTEFCQTSSVWGFHCCLCPSILMQIFFLGLNNQKSVELMQYYNPGFSVPLKPILKKTCVLETYLFMVTPVYLIHISCYVKPC